MPPIYVKQSGAWVEAKKIYVKQSGAWVEAKKIYVKQSGAWVEAHSGATTWNKTIAADVNNFDLRTAAIVDGWDQVTPLIATVTINSGVVVGSNSTGAYAFTVVGSFPSGSQISVINNGYIVGRGGDGGDGMQAGGYAGYAGGPALQAQVAMAMTNNGVIGGGGGGGGGGSEFTETNTWYHTGYTWTIGGGGGAGRVVGSGGALDNIGDPGTLTTGGNSGYVAYGGTGGALGSAGQAMFGAAGGAAGACVSGNSYIAWFATGSRYGSIT